MLTRANELIATAKDTEDQTAKAMMLQTAVDLMQNADMPEESYEDEEDD